MQVKTFSAETMHEALNLVKQEMGPDALILSTKKIRKKPFGLGDGGVEVTAAVEGESLELPPHPEEITRTHLHRGDQEPQPFVPPVFPPANPTTYPQAYPEKQPDRPRMSKVEILGEDPQKLRDKLVLPKELLHGLEEIKEVKQLLQRVERGSLAFSKDESSGLPAPLVQFSKRLEDQGINDEAIMAINEVLSKSLSEEELLDEALLMASTEQFLTHLFKDFQKPTHPQKQRRIALVGPTGVGKTTTLAKLAAASLITHKLKIALITIDIYRIAATEQLKVYGEIMNLPVDVVVSPIQLARTLARHADKDLILIDTAGRSPRDAHGIKEMASFLGSEFDTENHLVLSAATRERELFKTRSRFSDIPIHRMIFTKLDECEDFGILLNFFIKNQLPLSYLTHGQKVPEDIMPADPRETARLVLGL